MDGWGWRYKAESGKVAMANSQKKCEIVRAGGLTKTTSTTQLTHYTA